MLEYKLNYKIVFISFVMMLIVLTVMFILCKLTNIMIPYIHINKYVIYFIVFILLIGLHFYFVNLLIKHFKIIHQNEINKSLLHNIKTVTHDFKSPIKTLNGLVYLLDNKIKNVSDIKINEYTLKINEVLQYMNDILETNKQLYLNHTRKQTTQISIKILLENIIDIISFDMKNVNIIIKDDITINTNTYLLSRIIQNILVNIVQHNKQLNTIIINTYNKENTGYINFEYKSLSNIKDLKYKYDKNKNGLGLRIIKELLNHINGKLVFKQINDVFNLTVSFENNLNL